MKESSRVIFNALAYSVRARNKEAAVYWVRKFGYEDDEDDDDIPELMNSLRLIMVEEVGTGSGEGTYIEVGARILSLGVVVKHQRWLAIDIAVGIVEMMCNCFRGLAQRYVVMSYCVYDLREKLYLVSHDYPGGPPDGSCYQLVHKVLMQIGAYLRRRDRHVIYWIKLYLECNDNIGPTTMTKGEVVLMMLLKEFQVFSTIIQLHRLWYKANPGKDIIVYNAALLCLHKGLAEPRSCSSYKERFQQTVKVDDLILESLMTHVEKPMRMQNDFSYSLVPQQHLETLPPRSLLSSLKFKGGLSLFFLALN